MAFAQVEPFGVERADLQAALVASTVANTARNPKKRRRPFEVKEFLLQFWARATAPQQSWQDQLRIVEMLNVAFRGRDLRDKDGDVSDPGRQADG
jgi:hypothetical protein